MRIQQPLLDIWRLVLQADSPLSIASGRADLVDDVVLTTTPAGLPYIPATALVGVLRHALHDSVPRHAERAAHDKLVNDLFGFAVGDAGQASRLECTHAHIHDARGRVVTQLLAEVDARDAILGPLVNSLPVKRQRVRLNALGAAADTGHFDRSLVPAGHRFSVELRVWSPDAEAAQQARTLLQALVQSPAFRVGGLTRSGFGRLRVHQSAHRHFDLTQARDLQAYLSRPTDLGDVRGLQPNTFAAGGSPAGQGGWVSLPLGLKAEGAVRVGQGHIAYSERSKAKPADALPYTEVAVTWPSGKGETATLNPRIVIPATSIKGAVAHRLAFHDLRLRGQWATADTVSNALKEDARRPTGVAQWLGVINDTGGDLGAAGGLVFEDIVLPAPSQQQIGHRTHNSIDRFTGGVRDGLLFTEEYLFGVNLSTQVHLTPLALGRADAIAWQALQLTLDDLVGGRLAVGADSASGLGYLSGRYPTAELEQLRDTALAEQAARAAPKAQDAAQKAAA